MKAILDGMVEKTHLGLVQYGDKHLRQGMRMNVLQFITTKRERFASECEVRAFIEYGDPFAGHNLHFDANNFPHRRPLPENEPYRHHWVHDHKRRRIDLEALIRGIVLSPHASEEAAAMTRQWMQARGLSEQVRWSDLKNTG